MTNRSCRGSAPYCHKQQDEPWSQGPVIPPLRTPTTHPRQTVPVHFRRFDVYIPNLTSHPEWKARLISNIRNVERERLNAKGSEYASPSLNRPRGAPLQSSAFFSLTLTGISRSDRKRACLLAPLVGSIGSDAMLREYYPHGLEYDLR